MLKRDLIVAAAGVLGITVPAMAQTETTFTYQGELRSGGTPANGLHDLRFRLYREPTGGSQIGPELCANDVSFAEGRFSAQVDFGPGLFGTGRFLEIDVRADAGLDCSNAAGFVVLAPRQLITAAPNAIYATTAGSADVAALAISATSATNAAQLNGQPGAYYQNAANLSTGTIADARLGGVYTGVLTFSNAGNVLAGSGAALVGVNAERLDGLDSTSFLQSIPVPLTLSGTSAAQIIRAENASTGFIPVAIYGLCTGASGGTTGVRGESASTLGRGVMGFATANSGATYGGQFESLSTSGRGVYGLASAATGATQGVWGESASTAGRGVYGYATAATGTTYGGRFVSDSTAGQGVLGYATATTGTTYGGRFVNNSTEGFGVFGEATAASGFAYGGRFQSASTLGRGVYGEATAATGETFGGRFHSASSGGEGVYGVASSTSGNTAGVRGESVSDDYPAAGVKGVSSGAGGSGVVGVNSSTSTSGGAYGVRGHSVNGVGVYGAASGTTDLNYGVLGTSSSTSGRGVYGTMSVGTGITYGVYGHNAGHSGRGVYGVATSWDPVYGVLGEASGPGANGVFALGNMGASGTKSFRIDHPDDPENKYLLHYAAEAPEPQNFYNGVVTLDGTGEAVVELPRYFAKVNKSPRYTLTAVGSPMPMLHVAEKISEASLSASASMAPQDVALLCSFRIAGGAPGGEVSWEVKAVRNDRWVQQRGAPVEVEKQGPERGTYQHPELYAQPPEKGINYDAARADEPRADRPMSPH